MDKRQPLTWPASRIVSVIFLIVMTAAIVMWGLDQFAIRRLGRQLGASQSGYRFPTQFFRRQIPNGAKLSDVCNRIRGYREIRYYLVPLATDGDSVVIQQFSYPLLFRRLTVGVEYRNTVVTDVDIEPRGIRDARNLSVREAHQRLQAPPTRSLSTAEPSGKCTSEVETR